MHRPRIHAHYSARPTAGTRQLNQVGAAAQIDQGAWVVGPAAAFRRHQRGNRAVAGRVALPQAQPLWSGLAHHCSTVSQAGKGQILAALVVVAWISREGTSNGGSSQGRSRSGEIVSLWF